MFLVFLKFGNPLRQAPFHFPSVFLPLAGTAHMINQRVRGISHLVTACQSLLTLIIFSVWVALYGNLILGEGSINLAAYEGYGLIIVAGLVLNDLYRDRSNGPFPGQNPSVIGQIPGALRQTAVSIALLLLVLVLSKDRYLSRVFLISFIPIYYLTLLLSGHFLPAALARRLFTGNRQERMLLIGSPKRAAKIRPWLVAKQELGFMTVGILTEDRIDADPWPKVLGAPNELEKILTEHQISQVVLLQLPEVTSGFNEVLHEIENHGARLIILSNLDEQLRHQVYPFDDDGLNFFSLRHEPLESPFNRVVKRIVDIGVAVPAAVIILPLAAILVKISQSLQSPGPLFYWQRRAGIQNEEFNILKFRTMHVNGTPESQAREGDPRIFPAAKWFRRFSIDELPQFLNVIAGEMSVVGPRPHLVEHNQQFARVISEYHIRSLVKPGITGLAQVRGFRGETQQTEQIAARLQSDLVYLENWSLILDISIMMRTGWQLLFPPKTAR
jgi:exopolysaccharide biosynthesis polyprenyl glycosylphosphotransferase